MYVTIAYVPVIESQRRTCGAGLTIIFCGDWCQRRTMFLEGAHIWITYEKCLLKERGSNCLFLLSFSPCPMIPKLLSENIPRNASLMDKFIATFLFWQPLHDHISHSFRRQHILEGAANNYGFLMCSSGFDSSLVSRFSAKVRSFIRQFTCTPRRLHVTFFDQSFPFPFITISNEANEQPISFYIHSRQSRYDSL